MPTITEEPEPEPEALAQQQQILQLLQFLAAPQPEVVEQALAAAENEVVVLEQAATQQGQQ